MRKGIACIVFSAFGFALMSACIRLCDDYGAPVSCFQKGFFRNLVSLVIAVVVFARMRLKTHDTVHEAVGLTGRAWLVLLGRCVFGGFGIFANYYALSHIQVGDAMALNKTAPFFTVFLSWLILGERMTRRQFACLVLAFAGAMLVVKPGVRTTDLHAALLGLSSGLGAGIAYVCVHQLGRMKVPGTFIVLVFSAFSCLAAVPFTLADYTPMTGAQLATLLGAGVAAAIGQFGITAAYRYAEPRAIAGYDYTGVVFTALLGFVLFGQIPDWISAAGITIIILAAFCRTPPHAPVKNAREKF